MTTMSMRHSHSVVCLPIIAAVLMAVVTSIAGSTAHAWDGRDRLATGTPVSWSGGAVTVPASGFDAWASAREAMGLPADRSLVESPLGVTDLERALSALVDEGHLGWEVAWIAAGAAEHAWSDATATAWIEALRAIEAAGVVRDDDRRVLAALSLRARGSALGAVPPRCLPADPVELAALDAYVALELAVPPTRVGAPDEADAAALPVALSPWSRAARAVVTGLTAHPVEPLAEDAPCGATLAQLWIGAVRWAPEQTLEHVDGLRFAAEVGPVPARVVERIAVHAYLAMDVALLDALLDVEALQGRAGGATSARIAALRDGAAADVGGMIRRAATLAGDDTVTRWIRAEAARHDGRWDEAVALADALVAEDPGFVGAVLTRASAHLHRGTAELALADLEYLRLRWGSEPLYAAWIDRLASALATR